jgi:hypothetical protein
MSSLKPFRDLLVAALDIWIDAEQKSDEMGADGELLDDFKKAAVEAYNKASTALAEASKKRTSVVAAAAEVVEEAAVVVSVPAAAAAAEEVVIAEAEQQVAAAVVVEVPRIPSPIPFDAAAVEDWRTLPQWFKDRNTAYHAASLWGKGALREYQLRTGTWATLPNKKRVMIYKNHAYEPPADRDYCEPGPLKHLGFYNRASRSVEPLLSQEAPEIPQTLEGYPWTSVYEIYEANKRALVAGR